MPKLPNKSQCLDTIVEAGKGLLSKKDAESILDSVNRRRKKLVNSGQVENFKDSLMNALKQEAEALRMAAVIEKRNRVLNELRKQEFRAYVQNFKDPYQGVVAFLGGVNSPVNGSRLSVAAQINDVFDRTLGGFINDLEDEGVMEYFSPKELFGLFSKESQEIMDERGRMIARALWDLDNRVSPSSQKIDPEAIKAAKVIKKYQDELINRQNAAGAWINKLPGYIVRQNHDMGKLQAHGFEGWKAGILELLDEDKTFGDLKPDKWDEHLQEIYEGLSSGEHFHAKGSGEADGLSGFKGFGSLAKKLSKHRKLHFKDADAWFNYNQQFGAQTVQESVIFGFEASSRNAALMENMGPNPDSFYQTMMEELIENNRTNIGAVNRLRGRSLKQQLPYGSVVPDHLMAEVTGKTRVPGSVSMAKIGQTIRNWNNMTKLGGATISSLTDIPSAVAELRFQGISSNPVDGYMKSMKNIMGTLNTKEQQRLARMFGMGMEGQLGDLAARFSADDSLPGKMSGMQQKFFKLNLLSWWTDSNKSGIAFTMSNNLYENRGISLSKMEASNPDLHRVLRSFNIEDAEWDIMRETGFEMGGNGYIAPDQIKNIPDERIRKAIGADASDLKVKNFRRKVETKLGAYFQDRVNFAVPTPGAVERAVLNRGTNPGNLDGEFFRLMSQFKAFPVTVISKVLGRDFAAKGSPDTIAMVSYMFGTTVLGYMAMSAKDMLKGKSPRPFLDGGTLLASALQGGGFGIYGDFIFGDFSRFGNSALATLAGPTLSQVEDVADLWTRFRKEAVTGKWGEEDSAANLFRVAKNNTPFLNLFYTRTALDYLFLWHVQEAMNPGYLRRMEKRIMEDNKQQFLVPPSQVINRGRGLEGIPASIQNTAQELPDALANQLGQ